MNVENLPSLTPANFGNWVDPQRPILSMDWSVTDPHRVTPHHHPRAQILYVLSGVFHVITPLGNWVVPAGQAIWIPSHVVHDVYSNNAIQAFILFVDEAFTSALPKQCVTVKVSSLLKELFCKAVKYGNDYVAEGKEARLVDVMLDELDEMELANLYLPMAKDKRLIRIIDFLLDNPTERINMDELAQRVGASERTISRLFIKETGMTFSQWRKKYLLMKAIDKLDQGQPITTVALELGYSSASAFIAMFRKTLGMPPSLYLSDKRS